MIEKVLMVPKNIRCMTAKVFFAISGWILVVFWMRDNADVIRQRWFQVFKLPFVMRVVDFLEALLWFFNGDIFGLGVQDVDLDFPLANRPFPSRRRRKRIRECRVADVCIVRDRFVVFGVLRAVTNHHFACLVSVERNDRFFP